MPFIQYVLLKRNRLKAKDINAILCAWSKTRKAVPAMPGSPRGGDVVGSSSLFIHSTGQEEEREFCFMRRTREASSSFLLFKVRKEEAVEMGVGERREVMGERCTFSLASWAPSRDSRHLVVKTSKTSFPCLVSSCWPRASPSWSSFGSSRIYRSSAIPPVGQFAGLGWSSKCARLMSGSL